MMSEQSVIMEELEPGIIMLTMSRPERMNAYTMAMCKEFELALARFRDEDAYRVLIITGSGKAFSAGGDIKNDGLYTDSRRQLDAAVAMRDGIHRVISAIWNMDKPVIAAVNGPAIAGGLALAAACDFRIASAEAKAGDRSGAAGMLPDEGGAWLFTRLVRLDVALKMMLLNEIYDAEDAARLGFFTEVVNADSLMARTLEIARELGNAAPLSIRLTKLMTKRGLDGNLSDSMIDAQLAVMIANHSDDKAEGVEAFREKRPPRFSGH